MRLLQKSLQSLLLYSLVLVVASVPVSLFSIRAILNDEVDESLIAQSEQFQKHIKTFAYLDDLETDLTVLDKLSSNIHIRPSESKIAEARFETVILYDSLEKESRPIRQLHSGVDIKGKPYLLTVQLSLVDNNKLVFVIALVQTLLIILLVGGLLLLSRSLSRKLWEPFYSILSSLKNFQLDRAKSIEIIPTGINEFDDLNKTVSHLTERSTKVYLQQKEFIENASHELQTPLAIFQLKLDTLMQQSALSEREATTIMELEESLQRMTRLNKSLLLLSKIDNEQFTDHEPVDLADMIRRLISNLETITDKVAIQATTDALTIVANKTLTEILLTNLFHNAIRYTPAGGNITVTLTGRILTVSNTGTPLRMDHKKIFERFQKESGNTNSTGLGLAIVKKICDTCSYAITYKYENGWHIFEVQF